MPSGVTKNGFWGLTLAATRPAFHSPFLLTPPQPQARFPGSLPELQHIAEFRGLDSNKNSVRALLH